MFYFRDLTRSASNLVSCSIILSCRLRNRERDFSIAHSHSYPRYLLPGYTSAREKVILVIDNAEISLYRQMLLGFGVIKILRAILIKFYSQTTRYVNRNN